MKSSKLVIILTCLFLVACSSKSSSTPTNTPEPTLTLTPTQTPTNTPEPTPDYCDEDEFMAAYFKMAVITDGLSEQVQLILGENPDHQSIITELARLQNDLSKIDVPECMEYLKELLDSSLDNILTGETYMVVKNYSEATRLITLSTTDINLYADELDRLFDCVPNCEP